MNQPEKTAQTNSEGPSALAVFRYAAGLTQAELAEAAQISRVGLANLERGENAPRLQTARALSEALDVPVTQLFPSEEADRVADSTT